ncbi:MAG: BolA/IbaG family iron-sulfur metabolism protein [Methylocystis sp.]|nr:BolA/IbaG family iron-sulfur metabolism protein [Methylocystis sp.]
MTPLADDKYHWAATVTSPAFQGLSRVRQHQLVNAAFGGPQLYVNGEFIGGCDITREMHQSGELMALFDKEGIA